MKIVTSSLTAALSWLLRHPQKSEAKYVPPEPRPTAVEMEARRLDAMQAHAARERAAREAAQAKRMHGGNAAARRLRQRERQTKGKGNG